MRSLWRNVGETYCNTGQEEAYIQAFVMDPQSRLVGKPMRVSTEGASLIRWRADGKEIFLLDHDNRLSAATVDVNGINRRSEDRPDYFA